MPPTEQGSASAGQPLLAVEADVCEGAGQCELTAPQLFHVGDDDIVQILAQPTTAESVELALEAVNRCPKQALRLRSL